MQNLQLLSNTGEKCCKYDVAYILTHTIFSVVSLEVDLILCIPVDLLVFPQICKASLVHNWAYFCNRL